MIGSTNSSGHGWHSNPNLLDNWYFGNPVNQRGKTSHSGSGYLIDRWRFTSTNANIKLTNGLLRMENGDTVYTQITQDIDNSYQYAGKSVTVSVLANGNINGTIIVLDGNNWLGSKTINQSNELSIYYVTVTIPSSISKLSVGFRKSIAGSGYIDFLAVKLELGSTQTLAHQENGKWVLNEIPDFDEQLGKCKKYCRILSWSGRQYMVNNCIVATSGIAQIFLPPMARLDTVPVISGDITKFRLVVDGVLYSPTSFDVWFSNTTTLAIKLYGNFGQNANKPALVTYESANPLIITV